MTQGQEWTLTEAAKDCRRQNTKGEWSSVSRKTLQRALDKDKFPNAYRDDGPAGEGSGPWMIPKADLIAEGFIPGGGRTFVATDATPIGTQQEPHTPIGPTADETVGETSPMDLTPHVELEQLQAKLDESERERSELLRRAEVAEAIAEERGRSLDDVRTAMKMLEAGQIDTPAKTKATASKVKLRHRIFGDTSKGSTE